jgi:hypothetical protein
LIPPTTSEAMPLLFLLTTTTRELSVQFPSNYNQEPAYVGFPTTTTTTTQQVPVQF